MNKEKLHYNSLLRKYMKNVRRLHSLRAANRNERRQKILTKHIERLLTKLQSLRLSLQRGVVASSIAIGAIALTPNSAQAQSFGPVQINPFNLTNVGGYGYSNPTLGDLDGDGDLDMISGQFYYDYYGYGNFIYYENTGSSTNPNFAASQINPFGLTGVNQYAGLSPTLVDLDNDGDLDIMLNDRNGDFLYYENTGTPAAPNFAAAVTNPFSLNPGYLFGSGSQPTFADLDNDADLDMIIGNSNNSDLHYFENTGSATNPVFGPSQTNPFSITTTGSTGYLYHPKLVDLDGDGDFDILAGTYQYDGDFNTPDGRFRYFENTGTAAAPVFAAQVENPFGLLGTQYGFGLDVADIDGDGDLDIIGGQDYYGEGDFYVWEGCTPTTSNITATEACQYIAPSGAVYTATGVYTDVIPNSSNCDSIITIDLTIEPIADLTFTNNAISVCENSSGTLELSSSQNNFNYYLRDDANDTVVDGPFVGDGNPISFSTGNLTTPMTYNVYAEKPVPTGGLTFDGQGDYADAPNINVANSSFTIEFWAKRTATGNDDYIVAQGSATNNNGLHIGYRGNDQITFAFFGNDLNTSNTYTSTDWHHIAATYDNNTGDRIIYVDGVQVETDNSASAYTGSGNLRIGSTPWAGFGSGDHFEGNIDELRVWSTVRSSTEIMDNMNECLNGTETGLISYYKFETGTGTVASDETANGNDANLFNDTDWAEGSSVCATCNIVMTETATVTIDALPTVNVPTGDEEICIDETVNITPNSGGTWVSSDATVATVTNAGEVVGVSAGTVDMTFTDANTGCSNELGTAVITVNPDPTVSIPAGDEEICIGEIVNITPSTGGTWMSSDATVATITNTGEVEGLTAGSTDMTFTDGTTGCSNAAGTATITVNPAVDITVTNNTTSLTANATGATYQWLDCDDNNSVIAGATSQTFTPTSNGNYAVEVTENGCADTSDCEAITVLAVDENALGANINIYPNPTTGIINIDLGQGKSVDMKLISVEGRELFSKNVNEANITIDISSQPKGVYILQVSSGDEQSFHRIIKN